VCDGVVTLRGNVPTFHMRQLLVHRCQKVPGVTAVRDELRVRS
jgi:osmotically-inducible protein OsmY